MIDDGAHSQRSQLRTARILVPCLKDDVIYIIEDVKDPESIKSHLRKYNCQIGLTGPKKIANLVIVTKK